MGNHLKYEIVKVVHEKHSGCDYVNVSTLFFLCCFKVKSAQVDWYSYSEKTKQRWLQGAFDASCTQFMCVCVCVNMCLSIRLCVCACLHFLSGSDPSASRCCRHLLPCQSKATAECQSLVYRQLTCMSVLLECILCSIPVAVQCGLSYS